MGAGAVESAIPSELRIAGTGEVGDEIRQREDLATGPMSGTSWLSDEDKQYHN